MTQAGPQLPDRPVDNVSVIHALLLSSAHTRHLGYFPLSVADASAECVAVCPSRESSADFAWARCEGNCWLGVSV